MTGIEWTDATWNVMTGCTKVSPGCDRCYMFREYPRLRAMGVRGYDQSPDSVAFLEDRMDLPLRWVKPRRVFVCSMSDLFHPSAPYDFIERVFRVMWEAAEKRGHVFQLLTKRPGRAMGFWRERGAALGGEWHPNVWMGTSVESQRYAPRLTVLSRIPAPVLFCSAEPLLERIDLEPWLKDGRLRWIIVGGESGPGARPMDLDWARAVQRQAANAGAAFFLKQLGGPSDKRGGGKAVLDGRRWTEMPHSAKADREGALP